MKKASSLPPQPAQKSPKPARKLKYTATKDR